MTAVLKTFAEIDAAIATVFPDNHDEAIEPDDVRQFLENMRASLVGCNAALWTTSALALASTSSYADVTGYHASTGSDLTLSTSNGTITIPAGGDGSYWVSFAASINPTTSTSVIDFQVRKNSTDTAIYATTQGTDQSGLVQLTVVNVSAFGILTGLVAGDVLKVRQKNTSGSRTLNTWLQFGARRVA